PGAAGGSAMTPPVKDDSASHAAAVVQQYMQAVGSGDFGRARTLLHDQFLFQGPIDTFSNPDQLLASLEQLNTIVERVDVKKTSPDGDDVCLLYDMVTKTPAGTAFIAEWHHVKDGKIDRTRVVFDARPFAAMFEK